MNAAELNVHLLLAAGVVVVGVRAVGWLFGRFGQPRVMGEIVAGILLGPSVLGVLLPAVETYLFPGQVVGGLRTVAQFGLVLFMFLVGLEMDLGELRGSGRTVTVVAQASIAVPMVLAIGTAVLIYPRFGGGVSPVAFSLFFGAAMAVTAFPVLARLLLESGLAKRRVGVISLACAAINDLVAWVLVAVVVAVSGASGPGPVLLTLGLTVVFVAGMLLVVRPLLRRWGEPPVWAVLCLTLLAAWVAEQIGVHAIIGSFLAGLVMPRRAEWQRWLHDRISVVVGNLLLPIFFVVVGLSTRVDELTWAGAVLVVIVTAVAVLGKLGGSAVAARIAGERWRDAWTIGVLMNTRGVTEIVILTTGLQLGIISTTMFTVMVLMALITTVMAAPVLNLLERRSDEAVMSPAPAGRR
ncbi:cation:proton antiporter [Lentzea terrae]|uniref:cation:proton antiporter n=1 Tax=Lentzea terrae TaxID=2200761 RepID=UPI000DD3DB57|nr:cation:proton antiporter [Lentzea terrae]